MDIKNVKKILKIIGVLSIILVLILYKLPDKINVTMPLCSLEGEYVNANFDVYWKRFFFRPTELRGKISLDAQEYICIMDSQINFKRGDFWSNLVEKVNGDTYFPWFIKSGVYGLDIHDHWMMVFREENDFEQVGLLFFEEDTKITFYGPASTAEEAKAIYEKLYIEY